MRRKYVGRFIFRVAVFLAVGALAVFDPEAFGVMEPGGFFSRFSLLHVLRIKTGELFRCLEPGLY